MSQSNIIQLFAREEFKPSDDFAIKSINCTEWCGKVEFHVVVIMPIKTWKKYRNNKDLGHLYGVAISNAVHRQNEAIRAWNPTVDDRKRAANGIKTIYLTYGHRS